MKGKSANSVMSSKAKLNADASAAAGPVGRTTSAETDIAMKAEILSWSRARGVFRDVFLEGSTVQTTAATRVSTERNSARRRSFEKARVKTPRCGKELIDLLQKTSPKHAS